MQLVINLMGSCCQGYEKSVEFELTDSSVEANIISHDISRTVFDIYDLMDDMVLFDTTRCSGRQRQ